MAGQTGSKSEAYASRFIAAAINSLNRLDCNAIEQVAEALVATRQRGGRLFFVGVGGGAAHASHAVNDFRKLASFEAYAPTDNVAELTARINDEGWATSYSEWLRASKLDHRDLVFAFSVGGGSLEQNVSVNLIRCLQYAKAVGATVCGIVGRDGGYVAEVANASIIIPVSEPDLVTPQVEGIQSVLAHLLVSHPTIQTAKAKWESLSQQDGLLQ